MLVFFANISHTGHLSPCSGMSKKTHGVIKFTIFHSNTFFIPHFIIWFSRVRFPVPIKAPGPFPGVKITTRKNFISWNQRWPLDFLVWIFWESPIDFLFLTGSKIPGDRDRGFGIRKKNLENIPDPVGERGFLKRKNLQKISKFLSQE